MTASKLNRRKVNVAVGLAAVVLVGVLALFAVQLHSGQSTTRNDVEERFRDRARVTSALTDAIFSSAATAAPESANRYGAPVIDDRTMDEAAKEGNLAYAALVDDQGKVIAASSGLGERANSLPRSGALRRVLGGAPYSVSDVLPSGTIELAVGMETAQGRRILVSGTPPQLIGMFLGSYLTRIPSDDGTAYVLDGRGNVLADSSNPRAASGGPVKQPGLLAAMQDGAAGAFGKDQYFVAVPVSGTSWRVVLTSPESVLFASVSGLRKWTPWMIFAALAAVALACLVLLRRALSGAAALSEANDELENSNAALQQAAEMKSQFLANMSHEIRTPLNGVIGMTDLLLDTRLDLEQAEYARTARSSGEALLVVINDILDFSKIEAGRLELEEVEFDLPEAVSDVSDLLANRAHAKGLELASDISDGVPRLVRGDQARLRQVLTNLLSNAIKFTSEGEVITVVSSLERDGDRDVVRFEVRDTGIGIDSDQHKQLFESFYQADASTTRHYGGTGLGLAISKQLVELMGGEIGAEPRPGGGSVFWFWLPFTGVTAAPLVPPPEIDFNTLRLLVVDDNATNRTIVARQATTWGIAADSAENGPEALEMLRAAATAGRPYDIAVLDLMMPEMDGIELARRISADPALHATRLIMLASALTRRRDAEAAGIRAYLTKPARQSLLYDALANAAAVGVDGSLPTPEPVADATTVAAEGPPILVVEDNPVNQAVAQGMLVRRGYSVEIAQDGLEAVEAVFNGHHAAVLMDCQMPGMDGYEATAEIRRRQGAGAHIPIIAMTAHSMKGDRERCLAAGMDDYLSKPLDGKTLDAALARWVPQESAPVKTVASTAEAPATDDGPLDLATLERLQTELGGPDNGHGVEEVVRLFLDAAPGRTAALAAAVANGDHEELSHEAHSLKGASSTFGARRLAAVCLELEQAGRAGDLDRARALIPQLEQASTDTQVAMERQFANGHAQQSH